MKNKTRAFLFSVSAAFIITAALSVLSFDARSHSISRSVLRMHVVANSDSSADQQLKLKVRDSVLEAGRDLLAGGVSADEAQRMLIPERQRLIDAAKNTVEQNGFDYDVDVVIGKVYFPTRTYNGSITLPAGEYNAVNVIIGEGKGHNWWCVMFPPLCLPAAREDTALEDVLSDGEMKLVESNPRYEPRFKIIEMIEKLTEKFN